MTVTTMSIAKSKVRQSNFELLRIIAMFMVLILHADFVALGAPDKTEIINSPFVASIKVFLEMASIVAVNVFVLISGWFGIRPSIKGFASLIFQCLFFSVGIYLMTILIGHKEFSVGGLASCFTFNGGYWFILSFICLYFLAPVLNIFIKHTDKRTFAIVLLSFFIFQTLFSFLSGSANFLRRGYSALSFVGLYLLINYIKNYVNYKNIKCGFLYLALTLLGFCSYLMAEYTGCTFVTSRMLDYSNPIIIASSIFLLLFFSKVRLHSLVINFIAKSCFSAYLLHCNTNVWDIYLGTIQSQVVNQNSIEYIKVLIVIVVWFIMAVLIDQIRLLLWMLVSKATRQFIRDMELNII